eukprot:TRINITY_DN14620_c0_g1_i1.p1 TRINITY_DN14620_c0_g1~~TRINITY_DN14620_c0_g1_i1.p1  ORF type:complete len:189 (+),score=29.61 TRINITY_DN14620_c0_g1_i1:53-619(+)
MRNLQVVVFAIAVSLAAAADTLRASKCVPNTNHCFEQYCSSQVVNQAYAIQTSATLFHGGVQGHLATLEDLDEQALMLDPAFVFASHYMVAGTKVGNEWKWTAGPLSGQTFFNQGTGTCFAAACPWAAGQPSGDGPNLAILDQFNPGQWNDEPDNFVKCYMVEFEENCAGCTASVRQKLCSAGLNTAC